MAVLTDSPVGILLPQCGRRRGFNWGALAYFPCRTGEYPRILHIAPKYFGGGMAEILIITMIW